MPHAHVKTSLGLILIVILAGCQDLPSGSAGTQTPPPTVPELNERASVEVARAQRALMEGRLGAARDGFAAALRSSPNDVIAGLGLAETYLALNDHTTAVRVFELTARYASGRDQARVSQGLGLIALQQDQLGVARGHLQASVDGDPSLWRAWIGLGRLHARAGERNSARVAYAQAEASAPDLGTVMNDIGMSYLLERQPEDAVRYFERALVVDPGLEVARGNLRIARAVGGDYEMAISGAPMDELADTLNNVGYIAVVNGDFEVADRLLRRALELSPTYHEAAAANLNLLAHAQLSGQRPDGSKILPTRKTAQKPDAEALGAIALASAQPSTPDPRKEPAIPTAATPDRVAIAATQTRPVAGETHDVGFRWDERPAPVHELPVEHESQASPSADPATPPSVASAKQEPAELAAPISDTRDNGEFVWGDPTAPLADGPDTARAEPPITNTVAEPAAFHWDNGSANASPQQAAPSDLQSVTEDRHGFLWAE